MDCAPESPADRRSVCYDHAGQESRKEHRPKTTAMDLAVAMGIVLLTEKEYCTPQTLGEFDTKSSSCIVAPPDIFATDSAQLPTELAGMQWPSEG